MTISPPPTEDTLDKMLACLDFSEEPSSDKINSLLADADLFEGTFQSLLQLVSLDGECDEDYEAVVEALEQRFTEKLDELVATGHVEEEEYVDILGDEDEEDEDDDDDDEDDDEDEEGESEENEKDSIQVSSGKMSGKRLSPLDELKMLMAPVGKDEDDDDEEEYDEDEDDDEDYDLEENEDDNESSSKPAAAKLDMFADDEAANANLSSFERAQMALRAQIAALEEENVESDRPWALRGEITASQRPADSLLEEAVEFEHTSRPVPQVTEERTEAIEDIIKRRIAEAAWDDVERKDGRDLTLLNGMSAPVKGPRQLLEDVATAQPQRSLAQVFEDDLKAKLTGETAVDAETKQKRAELTSLFAKICRHIDGLSGNRFAPKVYAHSEIQIKTLGRK